MSGGLSLALGTGVDEQLQRAQDHLKCKLSNPRERRHRAILQGLLEELLEEGCLGDARVRQRILERFRMVEAPWDLSSGLSPLLAALREGHSVDDVASLVLDLYRNELTVSSQELVDRRVRGMPKPAEPPDALRELMRLSIQNRDEFALKLQRGDDREVRDEFFSWSLDFERWASAFVMVDWLPGEESHDSVTGGLVALGRGGDPKTRADSWVAVAHGASIELLALREYGKLSEGKSASIRLEDDRILSMARLRLEGHDVLAAGCLSGRIRLYTVSESDSLDEGRDLVSASPGEVWALSSLTRDGKAILAAASNVGYLSFVRVFQVEQDGTGSLLHRFQFPISRVRSLDLGLRDDGRYLLSAAAGLGGDVCTHTLDASGRPMGTSKRRSLSTRQLIVRLDRSHAPRYLVTAGRDGLVWCVRLGNQPPASRLRWTHRLTGPVSAIQPVEYDGRSCVAVATEDGKLVLLSLDDGRRLWKHGFDGLRIHQVVLANLQHAPSAAVRPALLLRFARGSICSLLPSGNREDNFRNLQLSHTSLRSQAGTPSCGGDTQARECRAFRAFDRLFNTPPSVQAALEEAPDRETRARVVRWLAERAEKAGWRPDRAEREAIVATLTGRDLILLLCYLDDAQDEWYQIVRNHLRTIQWDQLSREGDQGRRAYQVALIGWLQWYARGQARTYQDVVKVLRFERLQGRWACIEAARFLLQAPSQDGADRDEPDLFSPRLLPSLLSLPFDVLPQAARVASTDWPATEHLEALAQVMQDRTLLREGPPDRLAVLAQRLEPYRNRAGLEGLILALVGVWEQAQCLQGSSTGRSDSREAVAALRHLGKSLRDARPHEFSDEKVIGWFRDALHDSSAVPPDSSARVEREHWLVHAIATLEVPWTISFSSDQLGPGWVEVLLDLVEGTRDAAQRILRRELEHVRELVRPRLEARSNRWEPGRILVLELAAIPEGRPVLRDVTVELRADGDGGLCPAGESLVIRSDFHRYPPEAFKEEVCRFRGSTRTGQKRVRVTVLLQSSDTPLHQEDWEFPVPKETHSADPDAPFPDALPKAFASYVRTVLDRPGGGAVAVVDPGPCTDTLIELASARYEARIVDLGGALDEEGLRQGGPSIWKTIRQKLGLEEADSHPSEGNAGRVAKARLVVAHPCETLLVQLLQNRVFEPVRELLRLLTERERQQAPPRVVIVISRSAAASMRELGSGPFPEVRAHVPSVHTGDVACEASILADERRQWLVTRGGLESRQAAAVDSALDGHLSLLAQFLKTLRSSHGSTRVTVEEFLVTDPVARTILQEDLRGLDPVDFLLLVLGSVYETNVLLKDLRVGDVAAQALYSTTRGEHRGKPVLEPGAPITERTIGALHSDARPPEKVRIQGFTLSGASSSEVSSLREVCSQLPPEEVRAGRQHLQRLGLVDPLASTLRTLQPYRGSDLLTYPCVIPSPAGGRRRGVAIWPVTRARQVRARAPWSFHGPSWVFA